MAFAVALLLALALAVAGVAAAVAWVAASTDGGVLPLRRTTINSARGRLRREFIPFDSSQMGGAVE